MIKKLSAVLLLSSLFVISGVIFAEDAASEVTETKKVSKRRMNKSYSKNNGETSFVHANGVRHEQGDNTITHIKDVHDGSYKCSNRSCDKCRVSCAPKPVCRKYVPAYEPACEHKQIVTLYSCPDGTEEVLELEGRCGGGCRQDCGRRGCRGGRCRA